MVQCTYRAEENAHTNNMPSLLEQMFVGAFDERMATTRYCVSRENRRFCEALPEVRTI